MASIATPLGTASNYKSNNRHDSAHNSLTTPPSSPPQSPGENDYPSKQGSRASPVKITYPSVELLEPYAAELEDDENTPISDDLQVQTYHKTDRPKARRTSSIRQVMSSDDVFETVQPQYAPRSDSLTSPSRAPPAPPRTEPMNYNAFPPRKASMVSANGSPGRILSPVSLHDGSRSGTPSIQIDGLSLQDSHPVEQASEQLQYHHRTSPLKSSEMNASQSTIATFQTTSSDAPSEASYPPVSNRRSPYAQSESADGAILGLDYRGRSLTPGLIPDPRSISASGSRSPERPMSYIDLLNTPYSQQMVQQNTAADNAWLRDAVGSNASLMDSKKTLEMYRANVKKTNDPAVQYEFAIFMVNCAQDPESWDSGSGTPFPEPVRSVTPGRSATPGRASTPDPRSDLLKEAKQILQKLADKSYVFAQYYLADGYASGLFSKGKEDYGNAFPLFLSAGKHGHAEAGYRVALCYEFGWGCRRDYAKAVQFFRQAASKNHPGAAIRLGKACLNGDMGLQDKYREGVKWLKRAAESADEQHNSGPYELGLAHVTGHGADIFKDEAYAAQLFTQAAELGHAEANLRMGEAYEHGLLCCPRDPALSIHFYTGAASAGLPQAMMALCAWYMVGADPVLEKDEEEAYEWAKQAAELGMLCFVHQVEL
jgi:TPR repeat protein